ncbi:MAG: cation:dicarboxylase symporter family transporter [Thermoflexibacter sp.]|nr:cation:dicarboxylase symporter family transporter [Thermoflexibacter sp.]
MEIAFASLRWVVIFALCYYGYKKKNLTTWILVSMAVGAEIGYDFPDFAKNLKILSDIFLRLIKTIIAPLLIGTLVVGIAGHSDMKQVGRMGVKALVYFEVVTTLALVVGLIAINFTKAGEGIDLSVAQQSTEELTKVAHQDWKQIVLHIFPENIAKAIANGEVLQIVVFSILFAIGLTMVAPNHRKVMVGFLETLSEVMFKFTNIIMYFAPFAVGGAIAYTIGTMGLDIFKNLIMLLLTLYGALVAFVLLVLLPIALAVKVPLKKFLKAIAEPVSLAFATASSEAALPKAMKAMQSIGVPQKVVAFVMPTGYSFNLDGTTLYLSLASIFVAQAAGIDLPLETQIVMCLTLMLTSKGVAGVARASLVILSGTVASFNLPAEPIMVILGIDALMDMARTSVNVVGNCLATVVVAKWEGEFGKVDEEVDMTEMQEEMEH